MQKKQNLKKLLYALFLISGVAISTFKLTKAFFSDTEESIGNLFSNPYVNLQVGDSDPSVYQFGYSDFKRNEIYENEVAVVRAGGTGGNFSMEFSHDSSTEGINPEAETDTEGEGELDDCIEFRVVFDNGASEEVWFDWSNLTDIEGFIHNEGFMDGETDYWVNCGIANMKLQARTHNCGNEAMGDQFLMNIKFYFDET